MTQLLVRLNHLYDLCDECRLRKDRKNYPGFWLRREIKRIERQIN